MFEPLNAVCLVVQKRPGFHSAAFLGSCFAFRQRSHFLTAAHVIAGKKTESLSVLTPNEDVYTDVATVHIHPTADVAVLTLASPGLENVEPFWNHVGNWSLGEEYLAFGYPEDFVGRKEAMPTARLFRGHFQRFMKHKSHMGFEYLAAELSTPCPGGLSGGPLFRTRAPMMITGLVTENLEAATFLDEEVKEVGGEVQNHYYRRVINYGVAVMLSEVSDWLDSHIPPHQHKPA